MKNSLIKCSYVVAPAPEGYHIGLTGDFDRNVKYLARLGFEGVELGLRDITSVDARTIRETVKRYGLQIPAMLGTGRGLKEQGLFLCERDKDIRHRAIESLKEIIHFSGEVGTNCIAGLSLGNYEKSTYEDDFAHVIESLHECGIFAAEQGTVILIEPLDRFFPAMIRNVEDGMRLIDAVGMDSIKLCLDTFHMNIEEQSVTECIRRAKGYIGHVHIADDDRRAPGQGSMNLKEILKALEEIGYQGFVSAELSSDVDQIKGAVLTMEFFKFMFLAKHGSVDDVRKD
jgi:sugar phosphate isomerase/epimerase